MLIIVQETKMNKLMNYVVVYMDLFSNTTTKLFSEVVDFN